MKSGCGRGIVARWSRRVRGVVGLGGRKNRRKLVTCLAMIAMLVQLTPWRGGAVLAADVWTGATDSNWDTDTNWSVALKPTATDDVLFPTPIPATGGTINLLAGDLANSLSFRANYTLTGGDLMLTTGNVTVAPTFTATINSVLAGGGGITLSAANGLVGADAVTGGGTLVLGGANTYTGGTTINAGTLQITGFVANTVAPANENDLFGLGSGDVTVNAGGTLENRAGNNARVNILNNNIILNGGTFQHTIAGQLQLAAGKTINLTADSTINNVVANTGGKILLNAGQLASNPGVILTKNGAGVLQLAGAQAGFQGSVIINNGFVEFQNADSLGTGTTSVTVNSGGEFVASGVPVRHNVLVNTGGTISANGTGGAEFAGPINVAGNGTIGLRLFQAQGTPSQMKISGSLSGAGNLNVIGAPQFQAGGNALPPPAGSVAAEQASVLLTGDNSAYTGNFTVNANAQLRSMQGTGLNSLGTGAVVLNGGTLGISPQITAAGNTAGLFGKWALNPTLLGNGVIGGFDFGYAPAGGLTTATATRIDTTISTGDMTIAANRPTAINSSNNFGILYSGMLNISAAGAYTFSPGSDDGSMVYVDGQPVALNDVSQGVNFRSGITNLATGLHSIVIKYGEGGGGTSLVVNYSGPDTGGTQTILGSVAGALTNTGGVFVGNSTINNNISTTAGTRSSLDLSSTNVTSNGTLTFGADSQMLVTGLTGSETLTQTGAVTLSGRNAISTNITQALNGVQYGSSGADMVINGAIGEATPGSQLVKNGNRALTLGNTNSYTGQTSIFQGTLNLSAAAGGSVQGDLFADSRYFSSAVIQINETASNQIADNSKVTLIGYSGVGGANVTFTNGSSDTIGSLNFINNQGTSGQTVATGTGTLTLNGNINFSGNSTGANTISGNLNLGGATRTITSTALTNAVISAVVTNGAITKAGIGGLTLGGNNAAYAGQTIINGGKLSITNAGALGLTAANTQVNSGAYLDVVNVATAEPLTLNGNGLRVPLSTINNYGAAQYSGALQGSGGFAGAVSGAVTLGSDSSIGVPGGSLLTISGVISGSASLSKTQGTNAALILTSAVTGGPGILKLTAANTYTGSTIVRAGDLWLANAGGAALVNSTNVIIGDGSADATITGVNSNQFAVGTILTFAGGGKNAKLQLNGTTQTIAGFNDTGGSLAIIQNHETAGTGGQLTAGTLIVNNPADTSFSGLIRNQSNGLLGITKQGAGTLTLSGDGAFGAATNTYTGPTLISGGKLLLSDSTSFTSALTIAAGASFEVAMKSGRTLTDASPIVDNGAGFTKSGAGNLVLTSVTSVVTGPIQLTGGTLSLQGASNNVAGAPINISAGAQVQFNGVTATSISYNNNITLNGMTPGGAIVGSVISGTPTTNLTGSLTLNATSNVSTGWSDKTFTISGQITGAGGLVFDKLLFTQLPPLFNVTNATNNYSGGTTINAGTVNGLVDGTTLPSTGLLTFGGAFGGGQMTTSGVTSFTRAIGTGSGNVAFTGDGGGFSAVGGKLTLNFGNGTQPNLDWGGTAGLSAGASLILNNSFTAGNPGPLNANNEVEVVNNINLPGTRRIVTGANNSRFSGVLSGAGGLIIDGAGTLNMTGANANSYTGLTTIMGGTVILNKTGGNAINGDIQISSNQGGTRRIVQLGASNQIADTAVLSFLGSANNNGDFRMFGFNETVAGISDRSGGGVIELVDAGQTAGGNSTLTVNGNFDSFYNGFIRDVGGTGTGGILALTKNGTGTLTISQGQQSVGTSQTYSGATTINAGKLVYANIGTFNSTPTIAAGAALEFTQNLNQSSTFGKVIGGAGTVIKSGPGTMIFSAANTYTGTTTVTGGTLQIGSGATGSILDASNIADSGTVAFNRSNAYTYLGVISGTGGVTNIGAGPIVLGGANTYSGVTTVNAGTMTVAGSGISAGGLVLNAGGTLNLDFNQAAANPSGIVAASAPVTFAGGTLNVIGNAASTQTLGAVTATGGSSTLNASGNVTLTLGQLSHSGGGVLNFVLPGGTTTVKTTGATVGGIVGGWALTTNGTTPTFVAVDGSGNLSPLTTFSTDTWNGSNVSVTGSSSQAGSAVANSLYFNTAGANTVTLSGNNIVTSGGILMTTNVGAANTVITGGSLAGATAANGGDLIVHQNNTGSLTIASDIIDNGGPTGLTKLGAGALVLGGANTYSGRTLLIGGTLTVTNPLANMVAATVNAGTTLQFGDGATNNGGFASSVTNLGNVIIANPNDQTFSGAFNTSPEFAFTNGAISSPTSSQTGVLTKTGNGKLTINTTVLTNQFHQRLGETILDTGANVLVNGFNSVGQLNGDNATLTLRGASRMTENADFNVGEVSSTGTLNIQDVAQLNLGNLYVGKFGASTGSVMQTGGAVTNTAGGAADWRIGGGGSATDSGSTGTYTLSAGTFTTARNFQVGAFGTGTFTQTGGTGSVTGGTHVVGRFTGSTGVYNLSNGTFTNTTANRMIIGEQGTGTLNVSGAGQLIFTSTAVNSGLGIGGINAEVGTGTVNLNGGLIQAAQVFDPNLAAGNSTFNFNGGVLRVTGGSLAGATFMQGLTSAVVKSGGAIIDTNGVATTIAQPLLQDGGDTSGFLTKVNTGNLTLTGTNGVTLGTSIGTPNTYKGNTNVNGGGLILDVGGFTSTTPTNLIDSQSTLQLNGGTLTLLGHKNGAATTGLTATTALNSNVLTAISSTTTLAVGQPISGTNIPAGSIITSIPSATSVTISSPASAAGTAQALTLTAATFTSSQSFSSTQLNNGANGIVANTNGGSGTTINLGAINRNAGSSIDFTLPATGAITTTTANTAGTILGGWATANGGANWAVSAGDGSIPGNISALGAYVNDTWAAASNITVTAASTQAANAVTNSLRFNAAPPAGGALTVTLNATGGTINSGGILVTTGVGNNATVITGGPILAPGDLNVNQFNTANTLTLTSILNQSGNLVKAGGGVLILNAAETYTGDTIIGGGTLRIAAANRIPDSSSVVIGAGASFDLANVAETINGLSGYGSVVNSVAGTPTLTVGGGNASSTFSGILVNGTGNLNLTKVGGGTLTLNNVAAGSYTGSTNINAGAIDIATPNALANNTTINVNTAGGLLFETTVPVISGLGGNQAGSIFLQTQNSNLPVQLTIGNNSAAGTYAGGLNGTGTLIKSGTALQVLSGNISNDGGLVVNGGVLALTGSGGGNGNMFVNAGNLVLGNPNTFLGSGRSVVVANGAAVAIGSTTADPASNGFTSISSALPRINSGSTGVLALTSEGSVQTPISENLDFSAAGPGGALNLSLGATLNATAGLGTAPVQYTGVITPNANTFRLGGSTGRLILPNPATLAGANSLNIGGGGNQGGQLFLLANFGFTGATSINSGNTIITSLSNGGLASPIGASSAAASNLILNGGTLQFVGNGASTDRLFTVSTNSTALDASGTAPVNFTGTGAIGFLNSGARTFVLQGNNTGLNTLAAAIGDSVNVAGANNTVASATTALTKNGNGTWVLSGANTFSGGITVNNGVLMFASAGAVGSNTLNGPASVLVNAGGAAAFGSALTGSMQTSISRISPFSAGTVALTASTSENLNFDGGANGGTLPLAFLGAYGNVNYTGTFNPFGNVYRLGGGGGVLNMANGGLTGPRSVQIGGGGPGNSLLSNPNLNGAVVLNGTSDYSGGTQILAGGILSATNVAALGSGPLKFQGGVYRVLADATDITLASDGVSAREIRLTSDTVNVATTAGVEVVSGVNATFSKTFGAPLVFGANQGTSAFTKLGGGTLTLANGLIVNGSNQTGVISGTNNGTVTVERGTLILQSNPTFYNGLVQVGSGAGGVGTLKLGGNNVFASGPAFAAGSAIDIYNGSKFDLNGFSDTVRLVRGSGSIVNTGAPGATLTVGTANEVEVLGGHLSGNFNIVVAGQQTNLFGNGAAATSSLELWNSNNTQFTGKFTANASGIRIRSDGSLGSSTEPFAPDKITLNNTAVLYTAAAATPTFGSVIIGANHGITLGGGGGGTFWAFSNAAMIVNSPIAGPGMLTIADDTGNVFLASDNNTYAGGTQINSNALNRGVLAIGAGGATGSLPAGDVFFNSGAGLARMLFFKSTNMTVPNDFYGPGNILQIGSGTTTLTGNNNTNQTTVVSAGRLRADFTDPTKSPLGTGTIMQLSGGTFEYVAPAGDNALRLGALTATVFSSTNGLLATDMVGGGLGDATVQSTYGGSGVQQLIFAGNARGTAGVTMNFVTSGGTNGTTNRIEFASGPAVNNMIGAAYYFNGTDFAAYDVGNFVRAPIYGSDANTAALNAMTGSRYTKLTNTINNQGAVSMFGINFSGANAGLNMTGALTMTANPGALLKTGGGTNVIGGTGSISNNNQELIIRTDSAADTLRIDIPINGTGILTKSGAGQLILSAQNTYTGNTLLTQGTILVTGSGTLGSSTSGEIRIATVAGQTGTLNIDSPNATVTAGNPANAFRVGEAGIGFVNQSDGTVNVANYLTIGESLGSTGTYNMSGGTLNVKTNTGTPAAGTAGQNNLVVGRTGVGTLNISGNSTVNVQSGAQMLIAMGTNNSGQFQAMVPNAALGSGVGTVDQTGGTVNIATNNGIYQSNVIGAVIVGVDGAGAYNLTGGALNTPILGRGNGTASFTLGAATLRATAPTLNVDLPMTLTSSAANKSVLDTNGNDVTFTSRMTGAGGVAKAGDGTLTLIGNSAFAGGTDITGGNLVASGTGLGSGPVNVAPGTTLTVRGVQQGLLAKFFLAAHTDINPNQPGANAAMAPEFASLENFNNFVAGKDAVAVESTTARGKVSVDYLDLGGNSQNTALPPAVIALSNGSNPFVVQLSGKFNAPTTGDYNFQTRSDDGSVVWIDGVPILDNNRSQGQTLRSGSTSLTAGLHDITVGYYQGGGGAGFSVGVTLPDQGQSFTIGAELNMPNALLSNGDDALTIGSLVGSGNVDLGIGTLNTGNDNSSTTFTGVISGAGNLVKSGTGTMTIPNATAYTGTTSVNNGTLSVTGSVASSSNVIANGPGTFEAVGAQTLQGLTVNTGGTAKVLSGVTTGFLSGTGGTIQIGSSTLSTGSGNVNTSYAGNITGTGGLTKTGTGVQGLAGTNSYTGPTTISGGTLSVNGSIATSSSVTATAGGTFEAAASTRVKNLTLNGGQGRVVVSAALVKSVLTIGDGTAATNQLTITGGGKMDLTTNAIAIDYVAGNDASVLASIRTQILAGYNPTSPTAGDGTWNGTTGINSSSIDNKTAIGYALASEVLPFSNGTTDSFLGATVDKSTVLVRYTLSGDVNLDGIVDFLDLAKLAQSYNVTDGTRRWATGDVNYDGNTDFLDLAKLAQNYNTGLQPTTPVPGASISFENDLAKAFALVPEPGTISILGIGALALLARRRNRRAA
jgi:fibronectin-binding autotransporter adhesin